jgi:integrase
MIRSPRFGDYLDQMLADSFDLRQGSKAHYKQSAKHLEPLRSNRLTKLQTADLQGFFRDLIDADKSPALCADVKRLLSKVFKKAQAEDLITKNPLSGVKLPPVHRREVKPLTPEQVKAIADNILPRYRAAVLIAAYGGLRVSEIGGLRAEDVNLRTGKINIRQAVAKGGGVHVNKPKTRAGKRTVALPEFVLIELGKHILAFPPTPEGARVFSTSTGGYVQADAINKPFRHACDKAGLPDVHFHDLRHTAASLAIAAGASPKAVQERLGHANISVTLDTYSHLFGGEDEAIAERLNELGGAA